MGTALVTIGIGPDMTKAGELIRKKCGVPFTAFDSLTGLKNSDRFYRLLSKAAGLVVPRKYQRDRRILVDGMRDAAVRFGGRKVVLSQETGKALALATLLTDMGAVVPLAVIPIKTEAAPRIIAGNILVGDFSDITGSFDLLIAGSHGAQAAQALGVPHMEWGFPVFERLGFNASVNVGYKGTLSLINTIGNMLGGEK
jgi:nitrogenase molybdenum-iron protein NifN